MFLYQIQWNLAWILPILYYVHFTKIIIIWQIVKILWNLNCLQIFSLKFFFHNIRVNYSDHSYSCLFTYKVEPLTDGCLYCPKSLLISLPMYLLLIETISFIPYTIYGLLSVNILFPLFIRLLLNFNYPPVYNGRQRQSITFQKANGKGKKTGVV